MLWMISAVCKSPPLHCDIKSLKTVTEENNKQCIFPILPVIMFHSLSSSAGKPQIVTYRDTQIITKFILPLIEILKFDWLRQILYAAILRFLTNLIFLIYPLHVTY